LAAESAAAVGAAGLSGSGEAKSDDSSWKDEGAEDSDDSAGGLVDLTPCNPTALGCLCFELFCCRRAGHARLAQTCLWTR
jgi:hypothetical protein